MRSVPKMALGPTRKTNNEYSSEGNVLFNLLTDHVFVSINYVSLVKQSRNVIFKGIFSYNIFTLLFRSSRKCFYYFVIRFNTIMCTRMNIFTVLLLHRDIIDSKKHRPHVIATELLAALFAKQ